MASESFMRWEINNAMSSFEFCNFRPALKFIKLLAHAFPIKHSCVWSVNKFFLVCIIIIIAFNFRGQWSSHCCVSNFFGIIALKTAGE